MAGPILQTKALGKRFGNFAANADIDFSVNEGELRAVIGPNGAGKTTFFNLLSGFTPPTSGTITYKDREITNASGPARVRIGIAKAFQTANIYPNETVEQNVRLAALARIQGPFALQVFRRSNRLSAVDAGAARALDRVDLTRLSATRAGDLAHGDKKRLDIAIALATEPEILLLDEPVAGMSIDEAHRTEALIKKLAGEMTVLIIEHDMEIIMGISDSITVLHQGHVLATGTPAEIRNNQAVQEAYLGGHTESEIA
jgi:ABC-type branched-subunit amino acid transport system ATPase component